MSQLLERRRRLWPAATAGDGATRHGAGARFAEVCLLRRPTSVGVRHAKDGALLFIDFLGHLEEALSARGYFRPAAKKPKMIDNLSAVLTRPGFSEAEIKVLRGVLASLDYFSPKEPRGAGYPARKVAADTKLHGASGKPKLRKPAPKGEAKAGEGEGNA